jgi:hypothetical protein
VSRLPGPVDAGTRGCGDESRQGGAEGAARAAIPVPAIGLLRRRLPILRYQHRQANPQCKQAQPYEQLLGCREIGRRDSGSQRRVGHPAEYRWRKIRGLLCRSQEPQAQPQARLQPQLAESGYPAPRMCCRRCGWRFGSGQRLGPGGVLEQGRRPERRPVGAMFKSRGWRRFRHPMRPTRNRWVPHSTTSCMIRPETLETHRSLAWSWKPSR